MAYDSLAEIMRRVTPRTPGNPRADFSNFNPTEPMAWSYFIYLYLDATQNAEGRPSFILPRYNKSSNNFTYLGVNLDNHPLLNDYESYNLPIHTGALSLILDYINKLIIGWNTKPSIPGSKFGFVINRETDYKGCLNRANEARDVAWEIIMKYSAQLLNVYKDPWSRDVRLINPELARLFFEVHRFWRGVFPHAKLWVTSGYRESSTSEAGAAQTFHATGAAIDVIPQRDFHTLFDNEHTNLGRYIFEGYLAWLFRMIGKEKMGKIRIGEKEYDKIPHTICERRMSDGSGGVVHVSYGWLLGAIGDSATRKLVIPSRFRPYNNDLPYPQGFEIKPPSQLSPLLDTFNENTYVNDVYGIFKFGGITSGWLFDYIYYLFTHLEKEDPNRVKLGEHMSSMSWEILGQQPSIFNL